MTSDDAARDPRFPAAETAETAGRPPESAAGEPEPDFPAVPEPGPTGDPRVDEAVARLGELGGLPVHEHVEIFEELHRRLQDLLASAGQDETAPAARPAFPDALRPRP